MATAIITSERLRGEPHNLKYLPLIQELLGDPRVAATVTANGLPMPPEQAETILAQSEAHWQAHGFGRRIWFDRVTGEFIGTGGLKLNLLEGEPVVDAGYIIRPAYWGQGFATELTRVNLQQAFEEIGLRQVAAWTLPTNRASQHVMEKLGLRYERDIQWGGLPHVFYRISREVWHEHTAQP